MFASDADGKGKRMDRVDAVREKNRCFPRPPLSEKGGPNGCWYKAALNRLGYYTPQGGTGLTDDLDDADFQDALHAFQRQANVYFGDTDIGPGTTTERVLMDALEETDESAAYIWRTASDDKVRDEHAMRAGKIYTWDAPPDGDHPGDDYNCRCWAEPLNPAQHPWAVWAREQAERRDQTVQGLAAPMGFKDGIADLQTSVPLDAINSIYPIETLVSVMGGLGMGGIALRKAAPAAIKGISKAEEASATLASKIIKRKPSEGPYEAAIQGVRHVRFLKEYRNVSNKELKKAIKSFDKQINRHNEKIKNPEKAYPDFRNLDQRHQKDLLEKKWPSDIKRLEEQKEIVRRILDERN